MKEFNKISIDDIIAEEEKRKNIDGDEISKSERVFGKNNEFLKDVEGVGDILEDGLAKKTVEPSLEEITQEEELETPKIEKEFDKPKEELDEEKTKELVQNAINRTLPDNVGDRFEMANEKALEDYEQIDATTNLVFNRMKETTTIPIIMGENQVWNFQAKRIPDVTFRKILKKDIMNKNFTDLTDEELAEFMDMSFKLLEKCIVFENGKTLSYDEWSQEDSVLIQSLAGKVVLFLSTNNEADLLYDFKKK